MNNNHNHILLADDHGIIRLIVKMIIHKHLPGAAFHEAEDFEAVNRLISEIQFSLIVLDINMPGGDYFQTLELISKCQSDTKILVFSAYEESLYAIRSLEAGADGYIQKNSSTEEFNEAVRQILDIGHYASDNIKGEISLKDKLEKLKQEL